MNIDFDRIPRDALPALLRTMPKAELHLHIEGTLEPEMVFELAAKHGLDADRYHFALGTPDQVRELAAVLGIRYRRQKDGSIGHTSVITVLDEQGRVVDAFRGKRVVISMFYGTCPHVCPMLIQDIKRLVDAADADTRDQVEVIMVSFDPEHDTPAVLKTFADGAGADPAVWRFAVSDELGDLALYAGLTVVREGDGIAHGLRVLALDADGRLIRRFDDLAFSSDEAFEGMR